LEAQGSIGASSFGYPLVGTFVLTGLDLLVDGNPADIQGVQFGLLPDTQPTRAFWAYFGWRTRSARPPAELMPKAVAS
jgi:hypothetical protein